MDYDPITYNSCDEVKRTSPIPNVEYKSNTKKLKQTCPAMKPLIPARTSQLPLYNREMIRVVPQPAVPPARVFSTEVPIKAPRWISE